MLPILVLAACNGAPSHPPIDAPPAAVTRPVPYTPTAVPLARRPALATVRLPPSSRPDGAKAPDRFHPEEAFTYDKKGKQVAIWKTPLPVHSNLFPMREKGTHVFGNYPPPGLHVYGPDGELEHSRPVKQVGQYGFDREFLYVGAIPGAGAPDPKTIAIAFDKATRMENALNASSSERTGAEFAFRTITIDETSHTGVLLPAPAEASWPVRVPSAGVLTLRGTVIPPAIRSAVVSDGADLVLRVTPAGGAAVEVGRWGLDTGDWTDVRADLTSYENQEVTLALASEPRGNATFDYVFLEEPTVYTPSAHPKRLLLVFVDTLRRDHVGVYGYDRLTTPKLDGWAKHGAVFDDARTVAPWTLPSARATLSGAEPELWFEVDPLPSRLASAGFQTEAIVTNAFLSQTFDMHVGWSRFDYFHERGAPEVTDLMLERIDRYRDRDLALLVHIMEPHIPYEEPSSYASLFAGAKPDELPEVSRRELMKVRPGQAGFDEIKQYVIDRYDQNIRVADDEMARLVGAVGPEATVVFFSDHGEEFWDHGTFEHGHAFGDELLRIPLVIRGPAVQAGRVAAPASLLDVTPTVLELLGLPADVMHGKSLVPAIWGDAGALADRPRGFGRPLYGPDGFGPSVDGWGVVADGKKWFQRAGEQRLYDLAADPAEMTDLKDAPTEAYAAELAEALGREVVPVWRVALRNGRSVNTSETTLTFPGGVTDAWAAYDPRGEFASTRISVVEGVVHVVQPPGAELPPALYVRPAGDARNPAGLDVKMTSGKLSVGGLAAEGPVAFSRAGTPFLTVGDKGWGATVELVWSPVPTGVAVSGYDEAMRHELEALGYLDP